MGQSPEELLRVGLEQLGIQPSQELLSSLATYRNELQKWGSIHNLTSNLSDLSIISRHFLDSYIYLHGYPDAGPLAVADVGSGAGFPGLPLALIRPGDTFTLYEPRRKRVNFLRHMTRMLSLENVDVCEARIEDVHSPALRYDVIMTRALFEPEALMAATRNLLNPGGRWLLSLGPNRRLPTPSAGISLEIKKICLPIENVDRWLIILITPVVPRGTM